MVMNGETISSGGPNECSDCGTVLVNQVLQSAAGFYIGTQCECGPYSRESGYFSTYNAAEQALAVDPEGLTWDRLSSPVSGNYPAKRAQENEALD